MSSSKNLAAMFAQSQSQAPPQQPSQGSRSDIYSSHHSTSKAVHAEDDAHFENTSFQLKRTRSMGLLDDFIAPTRKLIEEDDLPPQPTTPQQLPSKQPTQPPPQPSVSQNPTSLDLEFGDDDDGQFIENVDELPQEQKKNRNVIYTYDDDANDYDDDSLYDNTTGSTRSSGNNENNPTSPSPPSSPDLYQPHDDNDIVYEPSRHVDYLSHNWKEGDISKSWRYIVLKRKDVANSARLENASWRTWAQAKYHLKTISPESVNWLKDSDVTWLYGPIYKDVEHADESLDKKYGSDGECDPSTLNAIKRESKKLPSTTPGSASSPSTKATRMGHFSKPPKPILKKRTVSEMLTQPSMIKLPHHHHPHNTPGQQLPSPPVQQQTAPSPPLFEDDFDLISKRVNAQYSKRSGTPQSGTNPLSIASESSKDEPQRRHIHFNDKVEQCIALNYPSSDEENADIEEYGDDEDEDGDVESDDSDDEGGFFLNVKSSSSAQLNRDFSMQSEDADVSDAEDDGESMASSMRKQLRIIELLPATTLKYGSDEEEDEDEDDDKFAVSHRIDTSRGYNYHYDYNTVYTGEQNQNLIHLGNNDYQIEDTPQHLEGVDMVDVPENIVLGSNIEVLDTPEVHIPPQHIEEVPAQTQTPLARSQSSGAFTLHSDESDSDSEAEVVNSSSPPVTAVQKSINKISSSPSSASLSDVAAHGYISQGTDLNELQREFGNLNASDNHGSPKGLKALMNTWKKS